jgi:3-oxoacyl-[acyl-carrier protein] reductase
MNILITGATSDISQSFKLHLQSQGHQVFLTSHSPKNDSKIIPFNLENPDQYKTELDRFLDSQKIDGLVLNAATPTYHLKPLHELSWLELTNFLNANIQGNLWLIQQLLPHFISQEFGRIVFISSMNNLHPINGYSGYAMAKSALETCMKYIAHEYGQYNIVANTLKLGVIRTQRNEKFIRRSSIREKMEASILLKRIGTPQDLNLALDTLLDKNCYIQGSTIEVSGGISYPL